MRKLIVIVALFVIASQLPSVAVAMLIPVVFIVALVGFFRWRPKMHRWILYQAIKQRRSS